MSKSVLLASLTLVFCSPGILRGQPDSIDGSRLPVKNAAAAGTPGLSDEELTERREALEKWAYEPVALEGVNYRLLMDRRNARFVLRDRRSGEKWYSSWGRKGFASILLNSVGVPSEWVPLDQVRRLVAGQKRIRCSVGPSARDTPAVDFVLEALPGGGGVRFQYEVPLASRERIRAVRLFDNCLWVSDADGGAIVLPRGLGEQLDADVREPVRRRLRGTPLLRPAAEPHSEAASLSCVGLLKGKNALLLRWFEEFLAVEVERRSVDGLAFPGTYGVFLSLESTRSRGAFELYTLGNVELGGVDVTRAYREVLGESNPATITYKTGKKSEHRSFIGAPLFRPATGGTGPDRSSFTDLVTFATGLKERLEIDRAAFVLQNALWLRPGDDEKPPRWSAQEPAGGEEGLAALGRKLRELGYLFGVEVPMSLLDDQATAMDEKRAVATDASGRVEAPPVEFVGPRDVEEVEVWARRTTLLEEVDPLSDLKDAFEFDLLFTRESPVELGDYEATPVIEARSAFFQRVFLSFDLVGMTPGTELDVEQGVYLGGTFKTSGKSWPAAAYFPFLPAAFSHSVRFGRSRAAPLQADDPQGVLFHLLLGEVPLYATPRSSEDWSRPARRKDDPDPRWVFARDDGWAEGQGLSTYEVFLRNTYEVLSHVARYRDRSMMLFHNRLRPDGSVRETYFSQDMRIVVNVGDSDYEDEEDDLILPPYGFYVRYPFLLAFHALRVNGHSYDRPVFYVVRSLEGKMIYRAERVNVYRGFGPSTLHLGGRRYEVPRQIVTKLW